MPFDWVTWGIWLVGFVILVVWIWVPAREIKKLIADHRRQSRHVNPPDRRP